ncbi:MAG: hypothetical protein AMXMBFR13_06730 [Phycisphaerae bacterium]
MPMPGEKASLRVDHLKATIRVYEDMIGIQIDGFQEPEAIDDKHSDVVTVDWGEWTNRRELGPIVIVRPDRRCESRNHTIRLIPAQAEQAKEITLRPAEMSLLRRALQDYNDNQRGWREPMIQEVADLLERLGGKPDGNVQSQCDNCGHVWQQNELKEAKDLGQRVDPGGPIPSGECPGCGALCYPTHDLRTGERRR